MKKLHLNTDPRVAQVFSGYPGPAKVTLSNIRQLILTTAAELEDITELEETLKWGEPSYLVKGGSTIRIAWHAKYPEKIGVYFKCTSKLVPTFKAVYGDIFDYESTRALLFYLNDPIPETQLKHCISMALRYHKIKHIPLLGA